MIFLPKISDEKKANRRNYILDVAFNLFSEKGYTATGLRDIMKAAKISKGGIYVYFNSKAEILMAIIQRFDETINKINIDQDSQNAELLFRAYVKNKLEAFRDIEYQKWVRVLSEFWSLPHIIPKISDINEYRFKTYNNNIKQIINLGIEQGVFRKDLDVESFIYQLMCTIDGAGSLSAVSNKIITHKQIEEIIKVNLLYIKGVEK